MSDRALIWWTDASAAIAAQKVISADAWPPSRHDRWPSYLATQFDSRLGRNGRGRLWDSGLFGAVQVREERFSTPTGRWITEAGMAGILFDRDDLSCVIGLPGIVTDMDLNRIAKET